ncbi:hypothetical protein LWI29_001047 [Acer saccharum]|uniref:Uncharacterized protein n=1 Tax=Acer saccharum TaxID=4024 RepID=A0AA39W7Y5_ACESA|nr:hypothetical protein LWI29_001047 [Acer saccharum]
MAEADIDMEMVDTDMAEAKVDMDADMFFSLWWTPRLKWTQRLTWTCYMFGRPWMDLGITNDSPATYRL